MGQYFVYILASQRNGTLYIGMTNDLIRRIYQHKNDLVEGFTKKYGIHRLVWYEVADTPLAAITREKQLKKWNRAWKLRLIEEMNPEWKDLYEEHHPMIGHLPLRASSFPRRREFSSLRWMPDKGIRESSSLHWMPDKGIRA